MCERELLAEIETDLRQGIEGEHTRETCFKVLARVIEAKQVAHEPKISFDRIMRLVEQAKQIPANLSTIEPIALTPVQIAYVAGMLAKDGQPAPDNYMAKAIAELKDRLRCGPNDEAGIGAHEVLAQLIDAAGK